MYQITTSSGEMFYCDAAEYIDSNYSPAEQDAADGFRALTIVHISDTEETYTDRTFALEGHSLSGGEETASIQTEDEEHGEATEEDFRAALEQLGVSV